MADTPDWLEWRNDEIRVDGRNLHNGCLVEADRFLRRDGQATWSARVTPYEVDADAWDGEGDPPIVLGKPVKAGPCTMADMDTATAMCEAWLVEACAKRGGW